MGDVNAATEKFLAFCKKQAAEAEPKQKGDCERCGGSTVLREMRDGYEYVVPCSCRHAIELQLALDHARIPELYRNATLFDDNQRHKYDIWGGDSRDPAAKKSQERALKRCRELFLDYKTFFVERQPINVRGLLLHGKYGLGKTRLMCSLMVDLIHAGFTRMRFIEYRSLFHQLRFSYNKESEASTESILEEMIDIPLLLIDDFGVSISAKNQVWVNDNIDFIINERYTRRKATLFTTNFWPPQHDEAGEDLPRLLSERTLSRMEETTEILRVEGYDFRPRAARKMRIERHKAMLKYQSQGTT